ncbi:hypothetical protein HDU76_006548, partial [Blyttiomyces sp. JEL0837]
MLSSTFYTLMIAGITTSVSAAAITTQTGDGGAACTGPQHPNTWWYCDHPPTTTQTSDGGAA